MEEFELNKNNPLVIYGSNVYTSKYICKLEQQGYHVEAVIDKNAEKLPENLYNGKKILSDVTFLDSRIREKCVVWIVLQNAMLHYEVAKHIIFVGGVERIIFSPLYKKIKDRNLQMHMIEAYNRMINAVSYSKVGKIPLVTQDFFSDLKNGCVIKEESETMIVSLPIEIIHTSIYEPSVYRNIPIVDFKPYFALLRYMHGEETDISEYIDKFGILNVGADREEKRRLIINKRKEQIDYLDYEYSMGMQYFVSGAPLASWNNSGKYFNMCEGQHRCVYLIDRGLREIPIRLHKKDYELADNYINK